MLTQSELKTQLHYDPDTGLFIRLSSRQRPDLVGKPTGCLNPLGYIVISIKNKLHYAHRLAWLYMTGEWPKFEIDHIGGNPSDNRWINLRHATHSENLKNITKHRTNTSGYKGVSFHKTNGTWLAKAECDGKQIYLGSFPTPELASNSYQDFAKKHHGDFYREAK